MPISSMIVRVVKDKVQEVAAAIGELDGASVSKIEGENLVVLTETATRQADKTLWDQIEALTGVVTVSLIYHNFEDLEERVQ